MSIPRTQIIFVVIHINANKKGAVIRRLFGIRRLSDSQDTLAIFCKPANQDASTTRAFAGSGQR